MNGAGAFIVFLSIGCALTAYLCPTWIAVSRHVRQWGPIVVINVFLGWTIIGWFVALALAVKTEDRKPYRLTVQQDYPPVTYLPPSNQRPQNRGY